MRNTIFFPLLLLPLILLCAACSHGSSPATPPALTIQQIAPLAGPRLGVATFSATITGGTPPYAYRWDFGTWGTPATSTDSAPAITLQGAAGTESGMLTVTDAVSGSMTQSFSFAITSDAVTAVTPGEHAGLPLGRATFEVTGTATPDSLAWDFGAGALPATVTGTTPEVVLQNPGTYSGTVTPTYGGVTGVPFPFEYTVDEPVAPSWQFMDIGAIVTNRDLKIGATLHDGRIAIVTNAPDGLRYWRANVAVPQVAADWSTHLIDADSSAPASIVSRGGRLIIFFGGPDATDGFRIGVSSVAEPSNSADWDLYTLGAGSPFPRPPKALFQRDSGDLVGFSGKKFRATGELLPDEGTDWEEITVSEIAGGLLPNTIALGEADNRLFAIYEVENVPFSSSNFLVAVALADEPDEPADWLLYEYKHAGPRTQTPFVFAWNDLPVILQRWGLPGARTLTLFRADTLEPDAASDWTETTVLDTGTETLGGSGGWVAGRLAFACQDQSQQQLLFARQIGTDPFAPSSWTQLPVDSTDWPGEGVTILDLGDRIALVYYTLDTLQLRVAISDGPF